MRFSKRLPQSLRSWRRRNKQAESFDESSQKRHRSGQAAKAPLGTGFMPPAVVIAPRRAGGIWPKSGASRRKGPAGLLCFFFRRQIR